MKGIPDMDQLFEAHDPFTCRHEGIGLPGCPTCDPVLEHVAAAYRWALKRALAAGPGGRQPPPTGEGRPILDLVLADLRQRDAAGTKKYGTTLRAHNGRKALVDAYQEVLDQAMYLRQQLEEDRGIAGQARADAFQEAINLAESLMHAEPQGQGDELSRIATYCNGTLRRLIAGLQARLGQDAAPPPARANACNLHDDCAAAEAQNQRGHCHDGECCRRDP